MIWSRLRGSPGGPEPVGLPAQRGVRGHALGDRQEPGQPGHGVRCRPQRDPPVRLRAPGAGHEPLRVQPVGDLAGGGLDLPVTQRREPPAELGVRDAPVGRLQAGRLPRHDRGPPLTHVPRAQRGHRVRQLGQQRLRQPHIPGPAVRRVPAGQPDLRRDPLTRPCPRAPPPRPAPPAGKPRSPRSPPPAPPRPPTSTAPTPPAAPTRSASSTDRSNPAKVAIHACTCAAEGRRRRRRAAGSRRELRHPPAHPIRLRTCVRF